MQKIEALCPAKINLTFDIKGKLEDGYHEVETLYQAISIYDQIVFEYCPDKPFAVKISAEDSRPEQFPCGPNNIIYKAADLFCQNLRSDVSFDLQVTIKKNIPIGAGLGGASSNAAATLMVLNGVFGKPFSSEKLAAIAAEVGSDVPFFITGGLALGTSRGEKLQPLKALANLWLVLIKPKEIAVQTSWAYAIFDEYIAVHDTAQLPRPDWRAAAGELKIDKLGNVFEPVIFEHYHLLAKLKKDVVLAGAICCHLTGSGSALYGVADSQKHAQEIADRLKQSALDVDIFVAQAIEHGIQLGEIGETQQSKKESRHAV